MNIAWHFPSQLLPFFWAGAMVLHMAVGPYRQTVRPWGWWWCVCGWPNHRGHVEKCMVDHWWDLRRYSLCSILARGLARMPKRSTKHSFSYSAPCVGYWEGNRCLRKLALQHQLLLKDAEGEKIIKVSLQNIRCNYHMLKGYTKAMAESGFILTNRITYLKPPIWAFYELMEVDCSHPGAKAVIHGSAKIVRHMLTMVKRKWTRWELPRAAGTP